MVSVNGFVEVVTLEGIDQQFYYETFKTKREFLKAMGDVYNHVNQNGSKVRMEFKNG